MCMEVSVVESKDGTCYEGRGGHLVVLCLPWPENEIWPDGSMYNSREASDGATVTFHAPWNNTED